MTCKFCIVTTTFLCRMCCDCNREMVLACNTLYPAVPVNLQHRELLCKHLSMSPKSFGLTSLSKFSNTRNVVLIQYVQIYCSTGTVCTHTDCRVHRQQTTLILHFSVAADFKKNWTFCQRQCRAQSYP